MLNRECKLPNHSKMAMEISSNLNSKQHHSKMFLELGPLAPLSQQHQTTHRWQHKLLQLSNLQEWANLLDRFKTQELGQTNKH